ncbi:MAG TPA: hypothetical protein VFU81_04325 [Thermomicrobiales bacterium]|nr:hypothetical protein [Thermomicrobiales bacterium]
MAIARTNQWRAMRTGSVRRVRSHCQPRLLMARKPNSIQTRSPYQLPSTAAGARSVNSRHGSVWPVP